MVADIEKALANRIQSSTYHVAKQQSVPSDFHVALHTDVNTVNKIIWIIHCYTFGKQNLYSKTLNRRKLDCCWCHGE